MSKNNVIVNKWLSQKGRFADLMNGCLFQGQQIVLPDQLEKLDRETDLFIPDKLDRKQKKGRGIQRYRDVAMRWNNKAEFTVLAIENQERIHYAMPVRTMIYDGLSYAEQIEEAWKDEEKNKQNIASEEFLSHFRKTDRLYPVITLVFYYGSIPWDGSRDLYEMIFPKEIDGSDAKIRKYIPNYAVNLVDVERLEDTTVFQTDLQYVLNMIKYREKKEKILEYVEENKSYFQHMNVDSYRALGVFLNSEKWLAENNIFEREGGTDMCKALEEIFEDGKEKGIEEGADGKLKELISRKLQKGKNPETIAEELEDSVDTIRRLIQEMSAV